MEDRVKSVQRIVSFDDIISRYNFVLLDTSALVSSLRFKRENEIVKNEEYYTDCYQSAIFLFKYAEKNKFYVTPLVLQEYLTGCRELKRIININQSKSEKNRYSGLIQLIESQCRENDNLARILDMKNKVNLEDDEKLLYENIKRRLSWIKENYKLGEADIDFLTHGIVISRTRGSISLVSNDFGILKAWNDFLRFTKTDKKQLGFFIRKRVDTFLAA
ncbi:hypothetical protein HYT25_03215 [Candidatus Pacearchaeota archaeon]|nr:hypothetical protein [Candidatus Pacearchaeota archaeon]